LRDKATLRPKHGVMLTMFSNGIGHIQRLGDGREERSERKLMDDMRKVHHCEDPAGASAFIPISLRNDRSGQLTVMSRMFPTHIPVPQRSHMQIPRDPFHPNAAVNPTCRASSWSFRRHTILRLSETLSVPSHIVSWAGGSTVIDVRVWRWGIGRSTAEETGKEGSQAR